MSQSHDNFIFTWIIKNYSFFDYEDNYSVHSPMFLGENLCSSRWKMSLLSQEGYNGVDKMISFVLTRLDDEDYPAVFVNTNMKIELSSTSDEVFASIEKEKLYFYEDTSYESDVVISAKQLEEKMRKSDEENLNIRCRFRMETTETTDNKSTMCCTAESEASFNVFSILMGFYFHSSNWSETKTFPINNKTQLRINLKAPQDDVLLEIERIDNVRIKPGHSFLRVKCEIFLIKDEVKEMSLGSDTFNFHRNEDKWRFPTILKKSSLGDENARHSLRLKFNFCVSNGLWFNKGIVETTQQNFPVLHKGSDDISAVSYLADALHSTLLNNELTDVSFRIGSQIISAHKCILASWSPIFSAMFKQQMVETETGVIDIKDMDVQNLKLFLEFLYTGKVQHLDWERSLQLLLAAEKYQVSPLKDKCSEYLQVRLTTDNVIDVVSVADMVRDQTLKKIAIDYIKENAEEIFSSPKWLTFVGKNTVLSSQIICEFSRNFKTFFKKIRKVK